MEPADARAGRPVRSAEWEGSYHIVHPHYRLISTLRIDADGSYEAVLVSGALSVDGCGGPFVGDGCFRGTWRQRESALEFSAEGRDGQVISFEGARLWRNRRGLVLETERDQLDVERLQ